MSSSSAGTWRGTTLMTEECKEAQNITRSELLGLATLGKETGQSLRVPVCPTTESKEEGKENMARKDERFKLCEDECL